MPEQRGLPTPEETGPTFTVVIPFYNEESDLGRTLASWAAQIRPPEAMLLVDNASTDRSPGIARSFASSLEGRIPVEVLRAATPGKVHALHEAQSRVRTRWAVFCDADTWYPPGYLEALDRKARSVGDDVVALMAVDLVRPRGHVASRLRMAWVLLLSRILPSRCHTGGYGQTFRTDALLRTGGFDHGIWPYVLMDHEIVHRLHRQGRSAYGPDLWCMPSQRRADRSRVRWTPFERALYLLGIPATDDWFWYRFLAGRFARRRLSQINLREKPWENQAS